MKVHITSLAFYIPGGDGSAGDNGPDQYLDVNSWLLEDYKDADSNEDESEGSNAARETLEEDMVSLIERKYFYAGGSARMFFEYSLETLLSSELETFCRKLARRSCQ